MNIRYPIYEGVYRILTDKEAKRNPLTHWIFSQAPHSFFSKPTGKNGQVARLNLPVLRAISTPSGRIPRKSLA